jgi:hypothetical protein
MLAMRQTYEFAPPGKQNKINTTRISGVPSSTPSNDAGAKATVRRIDLVVGDYETAYNCRTLAIAPPCYTCKPVVSFYLSPLEKL